MTKFSILMTLVSVPFLAGASCTSIPSATEPCDLLVKIPDAPVEVNRILIEKARPTAVGIAQHKLRYKKYCTT